MKTYVVDRESFRGERVSDRIILVKLIVGQRVVTLLSVYAPQSGLSDLDKDLFFDQLHAVMLGSQDPNF